MRLIYTIVKDIRNGEGDIDELYFELEEAVKQDLTSKIDETKELILRHTEYFEVTGDMTSKLEIISLESMLSQFQMELETLEKDSREFLDTLYVW